MSKNAIFVDSAGFAFGATVVSDTGSEYVLLVPTPVTLDLAGDVLIRRSDDKWTGYVTDCRRQGPNWRVSVSLSTEARD